MLETSFGLMTLGSSKTEKRKKKQQLKKNQNKQTNKQTNKQKQKQIHTFGGNLGFG